MGKVFLLNELMPAEEIDGVNVQKLFVDTIKSFSDLYAERKLGIEKKILTVKEPQETFICGSTLKKMILDIGDRDLKTYAMGMFLHGQILADQYHVDNWPDDLVDDLLNLTDDKGKNAMNEGIASVCSWGVLSLPVSEDLKKDDFEFNGKQNYQVLNYYGQNKKNEQSFGQHIDIRIRDFYEGQIRSLIKKYFYHDVDVNRFEHFSLLHDFSEMEINSFKDLVFKIKNSKSLFDKLNNEYSKAKAELFSIEKKIREAEKHAENDYVQELRRKKERIDDHIMLLMQNNADMLSRKRRLVDQIAANRKQKDSLSKKIEVANKNKKVDTVAGKLIYKIQKFLISFKEQKKKALEQKLMEKLRLYLHKNNLVKNVIVDITGNGDDVDINLYDFDNRKIDKGNLSMGERQMFASALLGALVEETEIEFPVFIDSPMQKFDASHTRNVLTKFYPKVSKQVVLFPLLMKEMTESEYKMISPLVGKAYLIENSENGSSFTEVKAETLFDKYKELKLC